MIKKYLIFLISIYSAANCMQMREIMNDKIDLNVIQIATAEVIECSEGNLLKVRLFE